MDMHDEQGNPVTDYDPAKGRLEMQKRIHHHEAVETVEEQGHWETVWEYPETGARMCNGSMRRGGSPEAWDEEETCWLYIPTRRRNWRRWKRTGTSLRRRSGEGVEGSAGAAVVRRNGGDGG